MRRRRLAAGLTVATLALGLAFAAVATGESASGFHTSLPALLTGVNGTDVEPIISVGDTVGDYMFEGIPDGISMLRPEGNTVDIVVNHELSLVPFPATRQDPSNSLLSRLRLDQGSAGVIEGRYVIGKTAGYQRFCSNFAVGPAHGFNRRLVFVSEEARDIVLRREDSWHQLRVTLSETGAEQAGVQVAYDVQSGESRSIYSMGRMNHENAVAVPGYGHPVVLTGDDTFDAPASQLFLFSAPNGQAVWDNSTSGKLYAFVANSPSGVNDYGDVTEGMTVHGHFLEVPRRIATGKNPDGSEVTSADLGYPRPDAPNPFPSQQTLAMPDGPQWVLEHWSNLNNVFQFIRVEDLTYDRDHPRIVYFADTGEPRAVQNPVTGRLRRAAGGTRDNYPNGRLFKLKLSGNPLHNAKLSILPGANFDNATPRYGNPNIPHQPDNVEATDDALYFQEDPGAHNSGDLANGGFAAATNARIWRYDLESGDLTVVAQVDQTPGPSGLFKGAWESSGIVDVSSVFGEGAFLVDVQAHTWDMAAGTGNDPPAVPQRERGQLLLIRVPGEGNDDGNNDDNDD